MWKYIISGAVVLLLGSSFCFYKTFDAMTAPSGEVVTMQNRFADAVKRSSEIESDKTIKRYAELRTAFFQQEQNRFDDEKAQFEAEDRVVEADIAQAEADLESAQNDYNSVKEEFDRFKQEAAETAELGEEDEDIVNAVGRKIAELVDANNTMEAQIAEEQKMIAELKAESDETLARSEVARKLNADRMARLSPRELSCTVIDANSEWDYVVLDAGIDKGIVIGSRLAVMRGDTKVCELNVTLVEAKRASCDIVYSTIRPGDRVRVGDHVIAVRDNK